MDTDLVRVWQLVNELTDQLSVNHKLAVTLQSQAGTLKEHASHSGPGFALRRFSTDISKETFESELERLNAHIVIENQTLLHENKQLSALLKEYEATMETIMTKFRNHALAAQQHELTLSRHYETLLLTRDTHSLTTDLTSSTNMSQFLHRLTHSLRCLLRTMAGESPESDPNFHHETDFDAEFSAEDLRDLHSLIESLDDKASYPGLEGRADWALERECEITRLEKENEELRKMLGIDEASVQEKGITLDVERDSGRNSTFLSSSLRRPTMEGYGMSGGIFTTARSMDGMGMGQTSGAPLQRAMELQPGMRTGPQARRTGMFGSGQLRGSAPIMAGGLGRGIGGGAQMWDNRQMQQSSPPPPQQQQQQQQYFQSGGMDFSR